MVYTQGLPEFTLSKLMNGLDAPWEDRDGEEGDEVGSVGHGEDEAVDTPEPNEHPLPLGRRQGGQTVVHH